MEKDIQEVFNSSKSDLLKHNKNTNKEYEVECRNFVFVSIATSIAMQLYQNEKVEIALGLIKICVNYNDCSKEFLNKCNKLTRICTNGKVKVVAPFIEWGKDKVLDFLKATKILPKDTWSCYYGNEEPCGNCPACNDRKYLGV